MTESITLANCSVAFTTEHGPLRHALREVTLSVPKGRFTAIVGHNGSGKSTLAKVMAGLLPVSRGSVNRNGRAAMVFQNPDAQIVGETVYEDICFGMENLAVAQGEMAAGAKAALRTVGLDVPLTHPAAALSGGQKQLLCIASALVMEPDLLVFDESTAMLHPPARSRILDVARTLHGNGATVVWITQWLDECAYAQQVVALADGRVAFAGTPAEFFYAEDGEPEAVAPCEALGFTPPFIVRTVAALRARGIRPAGRPLAMADLEAWVAQR